MIRTFEPIPSIVRAHLEQHAREVLDVRLGGGVVDDGRAGRERGRHERVLGAHDRRLVHEEVARAQPAARRDDRVRRAGRVDDRPERAERVEVRVEPAAADHVAAGRRHVHAPEAREQRPRAQERRADPLGQHAIDLAGGDVVRLERDDVLLAPLHLDPEALEQGEHRLDVLDARHVANDDLLLGQQRGRQRGQRAVLVAGGHDRPRERPPALYDELLHEARVPCRLS